MTVRIGVVGGGAGGVELALSAQHRLRRLLSERGDDPSRLCFALLTQGPEILPTHNAGVRARFRRVLGERGVEILTDHQVIELTGEALIADGHTPIATDAVIWVTTASAPAWPGEGGLAVTEEGFIRVDAQLQSISHPGIFAAGDVAALPDPRPKSGVFAVRQGPVLAENLRRAATGQGLKSYRPQRRFLGLISTGDRYAVASRGAWSLEGAWLWQVKDWIDRRFMLRFNDLPRMPVEQAAPPLAAGIADQEAIRELSTLAMRCGGCGAKVGSGVLTRVMQRLSAGTRADVLVGLDAPDDAAVIAVPPGKHLVQSADYFRAFLDDTFTFGLTVNGLVDPERVWRKGGLKPGDCLVLTKALGTGTLFAADMRRLAKGRWIDAAIASMVLTSQAAAQCLRRYGASACTDVTGFGLIGHLVEMTRASGVDAVLNLDTVPLLDGAAETVAAGILSSLQPQNLRLRRAVRDLEHVARHPWFPLLFDPQTAGGLLAGIPSDRADACVAELRAQGYGAAAVVGRVEARGVAAEPIAVQLGSPGATLGRSS